MLLHEPYLRSDPAMEDRPRLEASSRLVHHLGPSRHEERIARILALSEELGAPMSIAYLDSCDVRALPVILEHLEAKRRRRRTMPWISSFAR